jgi:hypothetical protein
MNLNDTLEELFFVCWFGRDGKFYCLKNFDGGNGFTFDRACALAKEYGYSVLNENMFFRMSGLLK